MIALIPTALRLLALMVKYGPTALSLIHQGLDLVNQISDPTERAEAAHDLAQAAAPGQPRAVTRAALKEVVAGLK